MRDGWYGQRNAKEETAMPVVLSGRSLLVGSNFQRTSAPSDICVFFASEMQRKMGIPIRAPVARKKSYVGSTLNWGILCIRSLPVHQIRLARRELGAGWLLTPSRRRPPPPPPRGTT